MVFLFVLVVLIYIVILFICFFFGVNFGFGDVICRGGILFYFYRGRYLLVFVFLGK